MEYTTRGPGANDRDLLRLVGWPALEARRTRDRSAGNTSWEVADEEASNALPENWNACNGHPDISEDDWAEATVPKP